MVEAVVDALCLRQPRVSDDGSRAQAAVALVLVGNPDRLLIIRRAEREGDPWSGHLALPGGRRQDVDADLIATAIRETAEETGLRLERASCRVQLDDLAPMTPSLPPIMVRPFVFLLSDADEPGVSSEVAHSMWLPFTHLAAEGAFGSRTVEVRGVSRQVSGYHLPEGFLWGMTERIVSPVVRAWEALVIGAAGDTSTDTTRPES